MQLPIPSPEKQRETVAEYKTIQPRGALNNSLIQKLEETAQAIYKHWFVAFEFPNEEGKPYKSSGGEMEFNVELKMEMPKGWSVENTGDLIDVINGYAFANSDFLEFGKFPFIKIGNVNNASVSLETNQYYCGKIEHLKKYSIESGDILISMTGSHMNQINSAVGKIGRYNYPYQAFLNQRVGKLQPKTRCKEFP